MDVVRVTTTDGHLAVLDTTQTKPGITEDHLGVRIYSGLDRHRTSLGSHLLPGTRITQLVLHLSHKPASVVDKSGCRLHLGLHQWSFHPLIVHRSEEEFLLLAPGVVAGLDELHTDLDWLA